jgi:hypothetical protein
MKYSKAACRSLPNEIKNYFYSNSIRELVKATEICSECPIKFECGQLGKSSYRNNGVWGGEILICSRPIGPRTIKVGLCDDKSIKYRW